MRAVPVAVLAVLALLVGLAQHASAASLRLVGLDGVEQRVDPETWSQLAQTTVRASAHDGHVASFQGVAAQELLRLVDAPLGNIRGTNAAVYVIAEGADGYRAVFALAEFDPAFSAKTILVADRRDGQALAEKDGPLRIVVTDEKRQARWVRNLTALILRRAD
jgi:hypothetical protein